MALMVMVMVVIAGVTFAATMLIDQESTTIRVPPPETKTMVACFSSGRMVFVDIVRSYEEEESGWSGKVEDKSGSLTATNFRGSGDWSCITSDVTYAGSK
jgi:hypothetical protein